MTFDKLYPKETYEEWRVVQSFAIAKICNKKTRTMRKRKRSAKIVIPRGVAVSNGHTCLRWKQCCNTFAIPRKRISIKRRDSLLAHHKCV